MKNKNFLQQIFSIQIVIFILIIPCHVFAQKTVQKTYCMSATSFDSTDALKKELLLNAKRQAVNEIFGELITAFTKVESGILTEDKIRLASAGLIRIKGNPIFQNGNNFGEMCVSIDTYATEEDRRKFLPTKITKKYCATKPELTTSQLKEFDKEQAIISALTDYDGKLKNHNKELVTLLHQITYLETGFVSETETYCVKLEGVVYPIELLIASSMEPDSQDTGKALHLDGDNAYVSVPDSSSLDISDSITIELWIKPTRTINFSTSYYPNLVCKDNDAYCLHFQSQGGQMKMCIVNSCYTSKTDIWLANIWYHTAFTYDGAKAVFYINGVPDLSIPLTGNIRTNNDELLIGKYQNSPQTIFDGVIDELHIWNRVLSQKEIQTNMNSELTGHENGLIACYNFNSLTPDGRIKDNSSNANHGVLRGNATLIKSDAPIFRFPDRRKF